MLRATLLLVALGRILCASNKSVQARTQGTYSLQGIFDAQSGTAGDASLTSDPSRGREVPEGTEDSQQTQTPFPPGPPTAKPQDANTYSQSDSSMKQADQTNQGSFEDKMQNVDWSDATDDMVRGLIHAFYANATLLNNEKKCMRRQIGGFVGDITSLATDAVKALRPAFNPQSSTTRSQKSFVPFLMDGVVKIADLAAVSSALLKTCVQGDGLRLLNQTANNLKNFSYMGDRLLVNGIDIAQAIAQGIIEFEHKHFYAFGEQLGIAFRKVLLSTATKNPVLPEGYPKDQIIAQCTEGIAAGFFAPGSQIVITDLANPDVEVDVDMNACVAKNHQLFRNIFEAFWILIAQLAANKDQHQFGLNTTQVATPGWVNELLLALMRMPSALTRCSVMTADSQQMWEEALRSFGSIRFNFTFPDDKIKADKATEKVALAVKYFAMHQYRLFGKELGKLFRELLLLAFPQKYSVDAIGRIQRLEEDVAIFRNKKGLGPVFVISGVAFTLLMSLAALKSLRVVGWRYEDRVLVDVESGDHTDDAGLLE